MLYIKIMQSAHICMYYMYKNKILASREIVKFTITGRTQSAVTCYAWLTLSVCCPRTPWQRRLHSLWQGRDGRVSWTQRLACTRNTKSHSTDSNKRQEKRVISRHRNSRLNCKMSPTPSTTEAALRALGGLRSPGQNYTEHQLIILQQIIQHLIFIK